MRPTHTFTDLYDHTLTWRVRHIVMLGEVPPHELARASNDLEMRTVLHHAAGRQERSAARYIKTEFFVGERIEHKTVSVPYEHIDLTAGVDYVPVRSWWREMLTMLLLPLVIALEPERVRTPWSRTTVYRGAVPFTYVESRNIDPFIEDLHGSAVVRSEAYIEKPMLDFANAEWVP